MKALTILLIFLTGCMSAPTVEYEAEEEVYVEAPEPEYEEEEDDGSWRDDLVATAEGTTEDEEEEEVEDAPIHGKFAVLSVDCWVRDKPAGKKSHALSAGRRLWVEEPDPGTGWYQVYTKRRLAYMSASCF